MVFFFTIFSLYNTMLLVKKVCTNQKFHMEEAIPYPGAKPMLLVEDIDNQDLLKKIVLDTYIDLIK